MTNNNVQFNVEIPESEGLSVYVRMMLLRECASFVTTFAGEWLKNISLLEDNGFTIDESGFLICNQRHFKVGAENLGTLTSFENILAVGKAIMDHNINATHTIPVQRDTSMSRRNCNLDCPPESHRHIRKV